VSIRIEWADVQGSILNGYGMQHVTYVTLHAHSRYAARRVLAAILGWVTAVVRWTAETQPSSAVNVAIAYSGFARLGLFPELLARFPEAIREGPAARAERLGAIGRSAPAEWECRLGTSRVPLLVTRNGRRAEDLTRERAALADLVRQVGGIEIVAVQRTESLEFGRELFGFDDPGTRLRAEVPRGPGAVRGHPRDGIPLRPGLQALHLLAAGGFA
jgi:hypothetical protein